ncbi:hypothetical protein KCV87_19380 [Actinosynnema pretiosum subsp. pretiosum]|uniref:Uncharacterized protein n=1 Tax=Actinosynnema pretiosum subsp. pretiosum TaxID=103721 RepID=A0AA45L2P1_9PSEU|nr:hypothetical protein KCV87_19380 [Actinosynnema pretiosum subsp. pretiosum]
MSTAAQSGPHAEHRDPTSEPPVPAVPVPPAPVPEAPPRASATAGLGSVVLALAVVGAASLAADLTSPVFGAATGALLLLGAAAVRALRRAGRTADRIFAEELPRPGTGPATLPGPRTPSDAHHKPTTRRTTPTSRRRPGRTRRPHRTAGRNGR